MCVGNGAVAGEPCQKVGILHFQQMLVFVELGVRQAVDRNVGKRTQNQVHFTDAAMPGAEQQLAPSRVQSLA